MSRDPESLVLEYEYWQQVLNDLTAMIEIPTELAEQTMQALTTTVVLATMIESRLTPVELDLFTEMSTLIAQTMETAKSLQRQVVAMGELVGGRLKAIEAEQNVDGG